jgi:acyl-homoserine lactone acylase PvdQ
LRFTRSLALLVLLALLAGTSLWTTPASAHLGPATLALASPYGRVSITRDAVGVLAFNKLFLRGNGSTWGKELLRARLASVVGPARAAQLTPAYTTDGPTIIPSAGGGPQLSQLGHPQTEPASSPELSATLNALLALHGTVAAEAGIGADGLGSNTWVFAGSRTTTGRPLLANDPHLSAQVPSFWYLAQLAFDGQRVISATVPGVPSVLIGHNGAIANDGDRFTVNVASSFRRWEDYDQFHAAQYRQIIDLRHLRASCWIVAPRQDGDPDGPHYDDLLERWRAVEYLPMRFTRAGQPK